MRESFDRLVGPRFEHVRNSWWLVPLACVAALVALSFGVEMIDRRFGGDATRWYLFQGGPEGARELLGTIGTSMLTFTGLVFSVTILVLQLASTQFSPRVLRTFFKDRFSQLCLGVFVGTFVYALLGQRSVRGASAGVEVYVPSFAVWLSVLLALVCVVFFVFYLHHIAQSIRAAVVIERIGSETREAIEHLFPEGLGRESADERLHPPTRAPAAVVRWQGRSGTLEHLDEAKLFELACEAGVVVGLVPMVGDFLPHGGPVMLVWGDAGGFDDVAACAAVHVAKERSVTQDAAFGFRELVDIAERALSPGTNDPTTAVQVLDELHDLLRRLARRRFPSPRRLDERHQVRVITPRPDFDAYVRLSLDEIRQYGSGSVQVARRLRHLIDDLRQVAPPWRVEELERQSVLLDAAVGRDFQTPEERTMARRPGPQGHGPAPEERLDA